MPKRPEWLKKTYHPSAQLKSVEDLLQDLSLHTVCREASCPNYSECFNRGTATVMILGANCTRSCGFCGVNSAAADPVDPDEPGHVGEAVKRLALKYVVVTSVTRDDLTDGGAAHFAKTVHAIRERSPQTKIEVLIPDFKGDSAALQSVLDAHPDVISHNMETVKALYRTVRPQADYAQSLELLRHVADAGLGVRSKSGIMVGVGETEAQIFELFDDLRAVSCEFLTLGQYLSPSPANLPVSAYYPPADFDRWAEIARAKGFSYVASAPFVRSSYHAEEALYPGDDH